MADVMMPDGSTMRIPDFALELTAKEMLLELKKLNKDMDKELEALVKATKEQIKQSAEHETNANKDRDDQTKTLKKIADNKGGILGNAKTGLSWLGRGSLSLGKGLGGLTLAAIGVATALSKVTLGAFLKLGNTLNDMTQSGVAFGDGVESGGMGAIDAMSQLRLSGLDAAAVMMNYSNVVQSLGKRSFVAFTDSFMAATDSGAALGMSLDESANRMGRELSKRQLLGALDERQREVQIKQITTTLKRQQAYATALGVSTEELAAFTDALLSRTPALTASLNRLSSDLRSKVIAGITDFGTAMRAMGGTEGGAIAEAFTEAAAMGGIGFSESMTGYITAMPSLAGPANEYIRAVQSGTLTQEQADRMAQNLTRTMGNASQAEKDRIFALARAGNAQAQSMANAIAQFEQSKNKIAEINRQLGSGLTMDGVQEGTNRLQSIIRMLGGALDGIKMQFLQGLGSVKSLTGAQGALKDAVDRIKTALFGMFNGVDKTSGIFEGVGDSAESLGAWFGRKLPDLITFFTDKIVYAIENIPKYIAEMKKAINKFTTETWPAIKTTFQNIVSAIMSTTDTIVKFKDGLLRFLAKFGLIKINEEKDADGNIIATSIEDVNWGRVGMAIGAAMAIKFAASKAISAMATKLFPAAGGAASSAAGTGGAAAGAGAAKLGKGIGAGTGAALKGLASGITAFANPMVVAGAAALGAAIVLIGGAIAGATWMVGASLPKMAEGLKSFESLDGAKLIDSGKGMGAIALGMAAFGVGSAIAGLGNMVGGITEGIGKLFGAEDPMEKLNRFASYNINADRVESNARAMIAFSNAMGLSAPGSAVAGLGTMIEGITGGIGRLFGAKDPMEELNRFAGYNINADRVENNARAMIAFSGAMAAGAAVSAVSGLGTMVEGIAGGIGRLFGAKDPMEELNRFASYNINADRVESNAKAMIAFSNAMGLSAPGSAVAGLGAMVEGIAGGIGRLFGAKDPMEELNRFASYNINADRVESNARAMVAFSNAMGLSAPGSAIAGLGAMIEGITGGIGRLFGAKDPMEELNRFASYNINADRVENNARAMIAFSGAMAAGAAVSAVSGLGTMVEGIAGGIGRLFGAKDPMEELNRFASYNINADRVENNAKAMIAFSGAMAVGGASSVVSGIGELVGGITGGISRLFGAEDHIEKLKRFSEYNINADRVENNARAMIAFSSAMAAGGASSAVSGIGAAVGAIGSAIANFFGGNTQLPWDKIIEFGNVTLPNQERINNNAQTLKAFGDAIRSIPQVQGTRQGGFMGAIAGFFSGDIRMPWDQLVEFGKLKLPSQENIKNNADTIAAFSEAMNAVPQVQGTRQGGLLDVVTWAFAGGVSMPWDQLIEFGKVKLPTKADIANNAEAIIAFGEAMNSVPEIKGTRTGGLFSGNMQMPWETLQEFTSVKMSAEDLAQITQNGEALRLFSNAIVDIPEIQGTKTGGLFSGNIQMPWETLQEFVRVKISAEDREQITQNSAALVLFGEALNNMPEVKSVDTGGWFSGTKMPWDLVRDFANIRFDQNKIKTNVDIMGIVSGFFTATPELSFSYSDESATSFNRLIDNLKEFQKLSGTDIATNARALSDAATTITNGTEGISQINDAISSNNRVRSRRQTNTENTTDTNSDAGLASTTDNRTPMEIAQNTARPETDAELRARIESMRAGTRPSRQERMAEVRARQLSATATPIVGPPTPVNMPEPVAEPQPTETDTETESSMPVNSTDLTELVAAMISEQRITNRLLRQGNTTTRDLARSL